MLKLGGFCLLALLLQSVVAVHAETALQAAATILWDDDPPAAENDQFSVRHEQACERSDNSGCYYDAQYYRLDNCTYRLVYTRHYDLPTSGHQFTNAQTIFTINFLKVKSVSRSHLFDNDDEYTLSGAEGMVCADDIRGKNCTETFPELGKRGKDTASRTERALAAFKEMQERYCN